MKDIYEDYYKPLINESPPEFKYQVGDKVHLSIGRHPFRRAYHQAWTEEIYTIVERINFHPPRYILKDLHNERFKSSVYEPELQKVNQSDQTSLFRIAKVLDYRTKYKQKQVKVKWLGYLDSFASWIPKADIQKYT